jgi:hypothetical protein
MLYLNSILFTMLRNCGLKKIPEGLCTDMAEYPTSSCEAGAIATSVAERLDLRILSAVRIARCAARCTHPQAPAGGFRSGQILPALSLLSSLSPDFAMARTAFELAQSASVAIIRALFSAPVGSIAASSAFRSLSSLRVLIRGVAAPTPH